MPTLCEMISQLRGELLEQLRDSIQQAKEGSIDVQRRGGLIARAEVLDATLSKVATIHDAAIDLFEVTNGSSAARMRENLKRLQAITRQIEQACAPPTQCATGAQVAAFVTAALAVILSEQPETQAQTDQLLNEVVSIAQLAASGNLLNRGQIQ